MTVAWIDDRTWAIRPLGERNLGWPKCSIPRPRRPWKRLRVDPTEDWEQLELLCVWDEQREYERIRPLVLSVGLGFSVPPRPCARPGLWRWTSVRRAR